eukprot:TRINITY_DN10533_c0_g1_i1.p1 TRINITY_DN10533_c0_g1~~TRINITY_DN10533_c0_g1_i1.p1  ORF type:complete len:1124 (+),score=158.78 TRINITY_DN10533_c0_g1_i1:745-4116(+)
MAGNGSAEDAVGPTSSDRMSGTLTETWQQSTPSEREAGPAPPCCVARPGVKLAAFLLVHVLAFWSCIAAITIFIKNRLWFFCATTGSAFLLSGLFCAHAAWHCRLTAGGQCSHLLPLKERPLILRWLLVVPYGWGQLVVIAMALDNHAAESNLLSSGGSLRESSVMFHCKAVNGMLEGFLSCTALLYALWGRNFPKDNPYVHLVTPEEGLMVSFCCAISFFSAGLGLLELDWCISSKVNKRMRRNTWYSLLHWLFRVSEVWSRVSPFLAFVMMTQRSIGWYAYLPLVLDLVVTLLLVTYYGGAETTSLVRLLCGVPCSFSNLFMFIDSKYKQAAARKLSRCLIVRNFIELAALMILAPVFNKADILEQMEELFGEHWKTTSLCMASIPCYWFLLWWVTADRFHSDESMDLFTACEKGNVQAVKETCGAFVGIDINCLDPYGRTPLMLAAINRHADVCRLLIEEKADVGIRMFEDSSELQSLIGVWRAQRRRWTAVHYAAWRGDSEVMAVLMEALEEDGCGAAVGGQSGANGQDVGHGAIPNGKRVFRDEAGDTPLHVAARYGNTEAVRQILQHRHEWRRLPNTRHLLPLDLARSEPIRILLRDFTVSDVRSTARRSPAPSSHAPLLLANGSETHSSELTSAISPPGSLNKAATEQQGSAADRRGSPAGAEPRPVQVNIVTTGNSFKAPGLCSFVASSSGGVLGNAFLIGNLTRRRLDTIDESTDSVLGCESAPTEDAESAGDPQEAGASFTASQPAPTMDDLDPINENRLPIFWWCEEAARQRRSGQMVTGKHFKRIPEESELGEGSYGKVWRALDRRSGVMYAVKNVRLTAGSVSIARRESEAADHISIHPHPCIVQLFHVHYYAEANLYCYIMEYCPGGDLRDYVQASREAARRSGGLLQYKPPEMMDVILAQVFLGLEHLHLKMGTLLRDLKPDNVVLTQNRTLAKLTDFGFCRLSTESDGTWSFGLPPGSPGYVSPEVIRGERYGAAADLYSMGVLTWVAYTGGILNRTDPCPPSSWGSSSQKGYQSLYEDYKILQSAVKNPQRNNSIPVTDTAAKDLIMQLVQRWPGSRPTHKEVRKCALFRHLGLPSLGMRPNAVRSWCEKVRLDRQKTASQPEASP